MLWEKPQNDYRQSFRQVGQVSLIFERAKFWQLQVSNRPNEGTKLGRITQETLLDAAVPLDKAKYGCKI